MPFKKSWISAHPFIVVGVILVVCLGPFLNQAIQTDDALFVWTAEWIQKHPADFFGFKVNWWASAIPMWVASYNPPLMSYFLAGVASLFGWNEIVLHLACLAVAFAAAAGIYALAKMWCERPLLATLVAIFTPAFLVSSTTLMCDVLMLGFWIWALVFWERALRGQSRWQYIGAGIFCGLAVLTKYSAVTLLPLLPVLSLLRIRKLGWGWLGLAVPLMMVAGYEWMTARLYGQGLLSAAGHYAQTHQFGFPGGWKAKGIIGLAFAGGSLLPLLFFAPWLWRRWTLLAASSLIFGTLLGVLWLGGDLGAIHPWGNTEVSGHWGFRLQVMLLSAAGLHLLLLAGVEVWQRRDGVSITLALWLANVFLFATVLNWTVSARSFLPAVPAAAILLVRRLNSRPDNLAGNDWLPLVPAAAIALSLVVANYQLANSARTAAKQIAAKYQPTNHQLWLNGHGGFQYYMEKLGGQPVDIEQSLLRPGDVVAVAWLSGSTATLPLGSVAPVDTVMLELRSWMNLQSTGAHGVAGFYTSDWGPIPFAYGGPPLQEYFIVKVVSPVQFKSRPANPKEVQAGAVPSFPGLDYSMDDGRVRPGNPAAMRQIQQASKLEKDGKIEEAIRRYREVLNADSNNPVALNNLALILAAAKDPQLRDGKEAVRLATRAVDVTELSQPGVIGTLAAAYAEDGEFTKAVALAHLARDLALLTGQLDLAARDLKLFNRYAAGIP